MAKNKGNSVQDMVIETDSSDFFDQLENNVNSAIVDAPKETTPPEPEQALTSEPVEVDSQEGTDPWEADNNPYKKRYRDSSREAVKMNTELKELEQYKALIGVMKKDKGAVDAVKNYLEGNAQPASVKERLGIDDDFVFDPDEAFADPKSQSGQLLNAHVDGIVSQRVNQAVQSYRNENAQTQKQEQTQKEYDDFITQKGYNPEQAEALKKAAAEHTLTWDDIDYLVNRGQVQDNIAQNTKQRMMKQISNAQSVPTTASRSGSADTEDVSHEDRVFDAIKGVDETLDNLFG